MTPRRVVCITHAAGNGGAAHSLALLLQHAPAPWSSLVLAPPSTDRQNAFASHGLTFETTDVRFLHPLYVDHAMPRDAWVKTNLGALRRASNGRTLRERLAELRPDAVLLNGLSCAWLAPWIRPWPTVLIARELVHEHPLGTGAVAASVRAGISAVVAISNREAEVLAPHVGCPVEVVENGFDVPFEAWSPAPPPARPGARFLTLGRIEDGKGQRHLAATVARHAAVLRHLQAEFVFVGTEQASAGAAGFAGELARLGIADLARHETWTDDPVRSILDADVVVRPDRSGCPWGRDIIEAMACGRPVVATELRRGFVTNDRTGLTVPVDDEARLGEALVRLAASRELRERLGAVALGEARRRFDPVENAARTFAVIERAMGAAKR